MNQNKTKGLKRDANNPDPLRRLAQLLKESKANNERIAELEKQLLEKELKESDNFVGEIKTHKSSDDPHTLDELRPKNLGWLRFM